MNVARSFAFLCGFVASCLCVFPSIAYASVATPSNADYSSSDDFDYFLDDDIEVASPSEIGDFVMDDAELMEGYYDWFEGLSKNEIQLYILAYVKQISDALSFGPGTSDTAILEDTEDLEEAEEEIEIDDSPLSVALSGDGAFPDRDVVLMRGTFAGTEYTLLVPMDYYSNLYVDSSGILYNLSASNITCRMFDGDFTPMDYEYHNLTLLPVLGNSSSTLYRYGYLSYRTHYYQGNSSTSLSSTTTYGNFLVEEMEVQRSRDVNYRIYYVTVIIFFTLGVLVLCSWKNYRR